MEFSTSYFDNICNVPKLLDQTAMELRLFEDYYVTF